MQCMGWCNQVKVGPLQPSSSRRPMHNSILTGAHRVNEILTGHDDLCKRNFRMEVGIFQDLVHRLREKKLFFYGYIVSVEEQVAILLYALAKNATTETLADYFQHSMQTINYYFKLMQLHCLPTLHPYPILNRPQFHPFLKVCVHA